MLTEREKLVIQLIAMGLNDKDIALKMNITPNTVRTNRQTIKNKIGLRHGVDIVKYALQHKIINEKYLYAENYEVDNKKNKVILK